MRYIASCALFIGIIFLSSCEGVYQDKTGDISNIDDVKSYNNNVEKTVVPEEESTKIYNEVEVVTIEDNNINKEVENALPVRELLVFRSFPKGHEGKHEERIVLLSNFEIIHSIHSWNESFDNDEGFIENHFFPINYQFNTDSNGQIEEVLVECAESLGKAKKKVPIRKVKFSLVEDKVSYLSPYKGYEDFSFYAEDIWDKPDHPNFPNIGYNTKAINQADFDLSVFE